MEIVVYASTLPIAARSTGTSRSATFVVTTGTAPPPSPRPRPPRPPPPVPAAEPEQAVAATSRARPERSMHARFDKVMDSRKRETGLVGIRAPRELHLPLRPGCFPHVLESVSP